MKWNVMLSWLVVVILGLSCARNTGKSSQDLVQKGNCEMIFTEYQHDFGKVEEGEKISYTFTFGNKGPGNLIISSATTTCGCTVPKYDAKPIAPGEKGNIEVVFDTYGRRGTQTKIITVNSNARIPVALLKITAEIINTNK